MKTILWVLLGVTFQVTFGNFQESSVVLSDCQHKTIEVVLAECTKKHLEESLSVPKTIHDLNSKCLSFKEAGLCLKNYAYRCMDDESRIKTGLILSGITAVGGAFCGSNQDKEDFLRHSSCLNMSAVSEITCRRSFMQVLRVVKFARPELKVGLSCCYYNDFAKCLDGILMEASDRCSTAAYEYFREMSGRFRSHTIDMLCGHKYNKNSERCDLILGQSITGRDIIVKYLIEVFASSADQDKKLFS